jgi:hypothetical protein
MPESIIAMPTSAPHSPTSTPSVLRSAWLSAHAGSV